MGPGAAALRRANCLKLREVSQSALRCFPKLWTFGARPRIGNTRNQAGAGSRIPAARGRGPDSPGKPNSLRLSRGPRKLAPVPIPREVVGLDVRGCCEDVGSHVAISRCFGPWARGAGVPAQVSTWAH
eukprot:5934189-Alexandrium_andersonii.AAC.2